MATILSLDWYGPALVSAFEKKIDLSADTIKLMACTNVYVPNLNTHQYKSDITNEVSGTNYTAGGIQITSPTVSWSTSALPYHWVFDGNDVTWPGPIPACRYLIGYDSSPSTDATRRLLFVATFDSDAIPSGVQWNAGGILTITPS